MRIMMVMADDAGEIRGPIMQRRNLVTTGRGASVVMRALLWLGDWVCSV